LAHTACCTPCNSHASHIIFYLDDPHFEFFIDRFNLLLKRQHSNLFFGVDDLHKLDAIYNIYSAFFNPLIFGCKKFLLSGNRTLFYNSAEKLTRLYHDKVSNDTLLNEQITILKSDIQLNKSVNDKPIVLACIDRLCQKNFVAFQLKMTFKQLIAQSYIAICDDDKRIGQQSIALHRLTDALYNIQLAHQASKNNQEKKNDYLACDKAIFNKIFEQLVGVHPVALYLANDTDYHRIKQLVQKGLYNYWIDANPKVFFLYLVSVL
jgi:DNA-binding Xre family transcriptional regulator